MHKVFIFLFVFINIHVFGQEIVRLDNAIQILGRKIEGDIRQGSSIAVVNIDSSSERFSNYIIGKLNEYFIHSSKRFIVAEQQRIELVRREEQRQLSLSFSDETAVRIGHNIGAQYIISGYLIDLGTTYSFGIYAINMQDAVRISQSSVYLSGYDEQISFLLTGNTIRPSEKIIPPNLTKASSKAAFMHTASTLIGNSLINRIPRNSKIAIIISGDFVEGDYFRNEINFILNNSRRFNVLAQNRVDQILNNVVPIGANTVQIMTREYDSKGNVSNTSIINQALNNLDVTQAIRNDQEIKNMFEDYFPENETEISESISVGVETVIRKNAGIYTDGQLREIGRLLGAEVIILGQYENLEYIFNYNDSSMDFSEVTFNTRVLYSASLQEITRSTSNWKWTDEGGEKSEPYKE